MAAGAAPLPRLFITAGEPAGIGPELVAELAASPLAADLVACSDADLIRRAAAVRGLALDLRPDDGGPLHVRPPGMLRLRPVPLTAPVTPGQLDAANAAFVLAALDAGIDACRATSGAALLTGPLHKGIINRAGTPFTGHTEWLARRTGSDVLMLLMHAGLRVALVTTHLPLAAVPGAVTPAALERALRILDAALRRDFGLARPRIAVLGLNPHAGEDGHLGREEIEVITPVLARLRAAGMDLLGPLPADTAFIPAQRARFDAALAMYHDQALPVLKAEAFDRAVNVTLGLPFVRTSVDHGTALELAGQGRASATSMLEAARWALRLAAGGAGR